MEMMRSSNLRKVTGVRSVDYRYLFQIMGMRKRTKLSN